MVKTHLPVQRGLVRSMGPQHCAISAARDCCRPARRFVSLVRRVSPTTLGRCLGLFLYTKMFLCQEAMTTVGCSFATCGPSVGMVCWNGFDTSPLSEDFLT